MKWHIQKKYESGIKNQEIIDYLISSRKIELNPPFPECPFKIPKKALGRIQKAIKDNEKIIVYGDYDADGVCATAILWEALYKLTKNVLPYIPKREGEGYGLSTKGIDNIIHDSQFSIHDSMLIITVDNGIMAHEAVDYANSKNIDVIIVDHHEPAQGGHPKAHSIVHTNKLCAAGIAHFIAQSLVNGHSSLELATIATITDLIPITGVNRAIVKYGLKSLNESKRPGIKALVEVCGIKNIGVYELGYMIGPRLNAAGRIDSALTALRLLCTNDIKKAQEYAQILNETNKHRQEMVDEQTLLATSHQSLVTIKDKIIFLEHESYHQGVIGLIAGKLTEKYYLPSIVISKGEEISKASARSIAGFNIIEAIRSAEDLLVNAGGHPLAAGFTIETKRIKYFESRIKEYANKAITPALLEKTLKIDAEISLTFLTFGLFEQLQGLAPFGIGNPEPIFASTCTIQSIRTVGNTGQHLKLVITPVKSHSGEEPVATTPESDSGRAPLARMTTLDAIFFNHGTMMAELKIGQPVQLAYSLALDTFNGNNKIQLKVRDIKINTD